MTTTVCLAPSPTLDYLDGGGGQLWTSLSWALGLQALGCRVVWLEPVFAEAEDVAAAAVDLLCGHLREAGLDAAIALFPQEDGRVPAGLDASCVDLDTACEADVLVSCQYSLPQAIVGRFARSALIDIDPGLLQLWVEDGQIELARYGSHFTIGETVGRPGAGIPDCGIRWRHTPPAVALDAWPLRCCPQGAAYTTSSHWWGLLRYLDLPARVPIPLEVAVGRDDVGEQRALLEQRGWRLRDTAEVTATPDRYRAYVQGSRGELSCVNRSCVRLQNAWIGARTLCYLATGRPAIVEHTGRSSFLPEDDGLVRFRGLEEAAAALARVEADYERHCRSARALAEEHFDARRVAGRLLEQVA